MLSALYAIARPSVCPSVTLVYQTKTVEVRIMTFSPYGSPIPLVLRIEFHLEILTGSPNLAPSGSVKQGRGGENILFSSYVNVSKTVGDTTTVTIND